MSLNKHFGEFLKNYIERKGLAIHKQAERIGISYQGYLKYYESENPRPQTKKKILDGLGITEEELFGLEEKKDEKFLALEKKYSELELKYIVAAEELLKYQNRRIAELQEAHQ